MAKGFNNRMTPMPLPRPAGVQPAAPAFIHWPYTEDATDQGGTEHFHWGIAAFHHYEYDTSTMVDMVSVEVEAPTEELAVARAMKIVQRANYRVTWVRETCTLDPDVKRQG